MQSELAAHREQASGEHSPWHYFPRCYDLSDAMALHTLAADVRLTAACNVLRRLVSCGFAPVAPTAAGSSRAGKEDCQRGNGVGNHSSGAPFSSRQCVLPCDGGAACGHGSACAGRAVTESLAAEAVKQVLEATGHMLASVSVAGLDLRAFPPPSRLELDELALRDCYLAMLESGETGDVAIGPSSREATRGRGQGRGTAIGRGGVRGGVMGRGMTRGRGAAGRNGVQSQQRTRSAFHQAITALSTPISAISLLRRASSTVGVEPDCPAKGKLSTDDACFDSRTVTDDSSAAPTDDEASPRNPSPRANLGAVGSMGHEATTGGWAVSPEMRSRLAELAAQLLSALEVLHPQSVLDGSRNVWVGKPVARAPCPRLLTCARRPAPHAGGYVYAHARAHAPEHTWRLHCASCPDAPPDPALTTHRCSSQASALRGEVSSC